MPCSSSNARPWQLQVGSNEVAWFVHKLKVRGASHGILIALNGITGQGETSAHSEVLGALIGDKIKILVLSTGKRFLG